MILKFKDFINEGLWTKGVDRSKTGEKRKESVDTCLDFVDMGECGKWATCNVGAKSPEEIGLFFAWGETEGEETDKQKFWSDYKFSIDKDGDRFSKYNKEDRLKILEPEDDAAHVHMGGKWRMPTIQEFQKLCQMCDWYWEKNYNNTKMQGMLFKLKTDESKQLFFPTVFGRGAYWGSYWSSSRNWEIPYAYKLNFYDLHIDDDMYKKRNYRLNIRGILD